MSCGESVPISISPNNDDDDDAEDECGPVGDR